MLNVTPSITWGVFSHLVYPVIYNTEKYFKIEAGIFLIYRLGHRDRLRQDDREIGETRLSLNREHTGLTPQEGDP